MQKTKVCSMKKLDLKDMI